MALAQTHAGDLHDPDKFADEPMVVKGEEKNRYHRAPVPIRLEEQSREILDVRQ
jgi:hypothetical protein